MTSDGENESEALTGGGLTKNRALVARVSNLSQDRPDIKFPSMQAWCVMANPTVRYSERVKRIGRYLAGVLVPLATERRPGSALGRRLGMRPSHSLSVSARTIMRGGHCLEVWTKKQQVVSVQRRERTVRGGQSCVTRAGDTKCGERPGNRVQTNPAPPSVWSTAGDWGKRNTSMCSTCGSRKLPSQ